MGESEGLICAYTLDGRGGGSTLDWTGIHAWTPDDGVLWVHLDRTADATREWVETRPEIEQAVVESLLRAEGNRPRVQRVKSALLVMLRGLNRADDADPEDMPTMHMWVSEQLIVTLRRRRLMAGNEIRNLLDDGHGPTSAGSFLVHMADRLIDPMSDLFTDLEEQIEALTDAVLRVDNAALRSELRSFRHAATQLRRHMSPQREALGRLASETVPWLTDLDRAYLRETADRTTRYVEDLDAARERATIAQEELSTRIADQMNRTMYLLTVVAALLLPPSLITGLFGINVGGMPGVENPVAFWMVLAGIPVLAVVEFIVLRQLRWI